MATLEQQFASMDLQEKTLLVHVKLLSGDILPITVQKECFLLALPIEFVRQAGYNPSLVSRLLFLDENGQNIREDPSWQKHFSQDIPLLHVLLQDEEDKDRQAKLDLFRKILRDKKMKTHLDSDAIWSMYSSWNITYSPPKKSNRYIKLMDFALAHPDVFLVMTQEEIEEREKAEKEERQRQIDLDEVRYWIRFRDTEQTIFERRMAHPLFVQKREEVRASLLESIQQFPDFRFLADLGQGLENRRIIRHFFTIPELIEMGIPLRSLSVDWCILRWHEYAAKAEAYLASPQ